MDAALLPRIAAGDQAAVPECVSRYGGLVWSLARRRLGNHADVEDAVQDIFVDLWRSASRFDPRIAEEITFVAMIARRRLIDGLRRRGRLPQAGSLDGTGGGGAVDPAIRDDGLRRIDLGDEARVAGAHLATLAPDEQRVLRLSIYDGLSHAEIAARTDLPLGTVKSHIRRGLDSLRRTLAMRARRGVAPEAHPAPRTTP